MPKLVEHIRAVAFDLDRTFVSGECGREQLRGSWQLSAGGDRTVMVESSRWVRGIQ